MPTNVSELRMERQKSSAVRFRDGAGIALLCMAGLVVSLVLLCHLTGTPDLSDVAQLVGP
jgi:hypothetical protein